VARQRNNGSPKAEQPSAPAASRRVPGRRMVKPPVSVNAGCRSLLRARLRPEVCGVSFGVLPEFLGTAVVAFCSKPDIAQKEWIICANWFLWLCCLSGRCLPSARPRPPHLRGASEDMATRHRPTATHRGSTAQDFITAASIAHAFGDGVVDGAVGVVDGAVGVGDGVVDGAVDVGVGGVGNPHTALSRRSAAIARGRLSREGEARGCCGPDLVRRRTACFAGNLS
jgi:hypothetical protein